MAEQPRILVLGGPNSSAECALERWQPDYEIVRVATVGEGVARLQHEHFDAVYANPHDPQVQEQAASLLQGGQILDVLDDGVAVVHPDLRVSWANATFENWCGADLKQRLFYEVLGSPEILGPDYAPFHTALAGKAATTRLHRQNNQYLDLHVTPVCDANHHVTQLITLARDITALVHQQQKLDALHQAGNELAALTSEQLADMGVDERIELLKHNIRRYTHDLLHYNVIEIRMLDQETRRLEPLMEEGMTPEAASRELYAADEGNGVTGFVAARGKSYLCPDTAVDPLYIEGAQGARSSLTVPLIFGEQVIGTFNVESPQTNAFADQDLQYVEMFCREIAAALHTLELLSAEKLSTASKSIEAISREVALPVDEILTATTAVLDRWIGHDPEGADKLRQILASARSIKQCIQKVGEDLVPAKPGSVHDLELHPGLRGMRVLVADNDERVRRSAHGLLGRVGCIVETARDGREALTMARLCNYDALLADIRLPDLTGYDVYQRLREAQPKARVILMTAYGYDPSHAIVKARQDGLRFVLYKPFRADQLLDALERPDPSTPT